MQVATQLYHDDLLCLVWGGDAITPTTNLVKHAAVPQTFRNMATELVRVQIQQAQRLAFADGWRDLADQSI